VNFMRRIVASCDEFRLILSFIVTYKLLIVMIIMAGVTAPATLRGLGQAGRRPLQMRVHSILQIFKSVAALGHNFSHSCQTAPEAS
jgi:hypothetical protein